jgi:glycosyltransferase involved in cell wall biosynthesis
MKNQPLFSIVVPTYNRAGLIMKTLDSVFAQTYSHYEVIVVDNKSTDHTAELLEPLHKAGKIRLIVQPENRERSVSRNTGFTNAKGDFVTILDSDDLMLKDNLKDAAEFIRTNPESLFFHNKYHMVNEQGHQIYSYRFPKQNSPQSLARGNYLSCIGVFLAKKIYTDYFFDEEPLLLGSEDWEYWLRIIAKYKLDTLDKINSLIVHHENRSLTKYNIESFIPKAEYIIRKFKADPSLDAVYKKEYPVIHSAAYLFAASRANSMKLYTDARRYLRRALHLDASAKYETRFWKILIINILRKKNEHQI